MSDAPSGEPRVASAVVELDLPCDWCGHNLRGLSREGECPECQLALEHSLRPDRFEFAGPGWFTRLGAGTALVLLQVLAGVALMLVVWSTLTVNRYSIF